MHTRHLFLLGAMLVPCVAPGAAAQLHDQQQPSGPTYFTVSVQPGNYMLTVKEIRWGSSPRISVPKAVERSGSALQARPGSKPGSAWPSNTVELVWLTQRTDSLPATWMQTASRAPSEITITAMSPAGQPLARYVLHYAVPTKYWLDQMDSGASKISLTHLTLMAQSVTSLPAGS